MRRFALAWLVAVAACRGGVPTVGDRMQAVEDRIRTLAGDPERPWEALTVQATPADRARVSASGFDPDSLPTPDLVAFAAILECVDGLQPAEWTDAVAAIGRGEHVGLAWGMFCHAGIRHDFAAMARLGAAALRVVPAENRSYALAKRCELFFGARADGEAILTGFDGALRLLQQQGTADEQALLTALFADEKRR